MSLSFRAIKTIIKELWYQKMSSDLRKKMDELDKDPEMHEKYKDKWNRFKPY